MGPIKWLFQWLILLAIGSCNTVSIKKTVESTQSLLHLPSAAVLRQKISDFKSRTQKRGSKLSASDWKLHDELLSYYRELSKRKISPSSVTVPRNSQKKVIAKSFCLDHGGAIPSPGESFKWKKGIPSIPYYKAIVSKAFRKEISQEAAQSLLWNLKRGTYWENYSKDSRELLLSIDTKAPVVLPSKLRAKAQESAKDYLFNKVPILQKTADQLSELKGEYLEYAQVAQEVAANISKYPYIPDLNRHDIPSSQLKAQVQSDGYSKQEITLTNPTDTDIDIDLNDYFLEPLRKDVQPIGFGGFASNGEQLYEVYEDLEHALYDDLLRLGIGFTPGINDVADAYEFLLGRDFLSDQKLSLGGRLLSGVGLVAGSGAGYRYAERAAAAPDRMVLKFEEEFARGSNKSIQSGLRNGEARTAIDEFQQVKRQIEEVPLLKEKISNPNFKKTDFYVRENGDVIPSKGYRYVSSDASYADEFLKSGKIPATKDPRGTYVSFDKYTHSKQAIDKLQLPPVNNAHYRVEFDTKQVLDDIKIPWGNYGKSNKLEPLAEDFMKRGSGNGRQAITQGEIAAEKIIDLRTGATVYAKPKL